jgi:hypothetical protein
MYNKIINLFRAPIEQLDEKIEKEMPNKTGWYWFRFRSNKKVYFPTFVVIDILMYKVWGDSDYRNLLLTDKDQWGGAISMWRDSLLPSVITFLKE